MILLLPFQFETSFISFLVSLLWLGLLVLLISGKNEYPSLDPNLKRNCFQLFTVNTMLAMCLSYKVSIMLRYVSSMPTFWRTFIINGC